MTTEQLDVFLKDLTELTRRHGIKISGCGCCGSPFLEEIEEGERGNQYSIDDFHGMLCFLDVETIEDLERHTYEL